MVNVQGGMAFYHPDGLVPSWNHALQFATIGGRIATLPDIIDARMNTKPGDYPWLRYFTTASAEYLGMTRGGNKVLIVAHGVGPMATLAGIQQAYSYQYNDKEGNRRGGRITQEQFWDLEAGRYGEVKVVDFKKFMFRYKYAFLEQIRSEAAEYDRLVEARLGRRYRDYLWRHERFAREWHRQQANLIPENQYGLSDWNSYVARRADMHMQDAGNPKGPFILELTDASGCNYEYTPVGEGMAFAHLLTIGGLTCLHHSDVYNEKHESLVTEIGLQGWTDGARFVGVKPEVSRVEDIDPGFGYPPELIRRHWRLLMESANPDSVENFFALVRMEDGTFFTQVLKKGAAMDTWEPEYRVADLQPMGSARLLTEIGGYHQFVRFEIREVRAIAPAGANAYMIEGEPKVLWEDGNPKYHHIPISYYSVSIDSTQRAMRAKKLQNDYGLLMRLWEIEKGKNTQVI